jgi:hypothetical protein
VTPCGLAHTYAPTRRFVICPLPPADGGAASHCTRPTDLHMHPRQNLNTPSSLFLSVFIRHRSLMACLTLRNAVASFKSHCQIRKQTVKLGQCEMPPACRRYASCVLPIAPHVRPDVCHLPNCLYTVRHTNLGRTPRGAWREGVGGHRYVRHRLQRRTPLSFEKGKNVTYSFPAGSV